ARPARTGAAGGGELRVSAAALVLRPRFRARAAARVSVRGGSVPPGLRGAALPRGGRGRGLGGAPRAPRARAAPGRRALARALVRWPGGARSRREVRGRAGAAAPARRASRRPRRPRRAPCAAPRPPTPAAQRLPRAPLTASQLLGYGVDGVLQDGGQ